MNTLNYNLIFFGLLIIFFALIYFLDKKFFMLRDNSNATPKPYSWSRVQLSWWTSIIVCSFITAIVKSGSFIPTFDDSTLYLLGISSITTIGATLIDISDQTNPNLTGLSQNIKGDNFFLDILSDKNGINIHRFQTVVFNLIFGVWFIIKVTKNVNVPINLASCDELKKLTDLTKYNQCLDGYLINFANSIIPKISPNNLILLGVSSGLYQALKITENKQSSVTEDPQPLKVADENQPIANIISKG